METELCKLHFDYRKPIKLDITREECVFITRYLYEKAQLLQLDDLTELLVFDKLLEILKKLTTRIQSYTTIRKISISYTQAKAIKYVYEHHGCFDEPLLILEFMNVYTKIDRQL